MGSGDPQERLRDWHEQAEGGGVLQQYLTVQRLYPNQEMSCTGRRGRVRPWEKEGGGRDVGSLDNNPSPSHRFAGVVKVRVICWWICPIS